MTHVQTEAEDMIINFQSISLQDNKMRQLQLTMDLLYVESMQWIPFACLWMEINFSEMIQKQKFVLQTNYSSMLTIRMNGTGTGEPLTEKLLMEFVVSEKNKPMITLKECLLVLFNVAILKAMLIRLDSCLRNSPSRLLLIIGL